MIRHISIKNFATIENAEIDFNDGLNIITGETGAGKSIVIEAVSLALGSRADTSYVRSGKDKALIQMIAEYNEKEYIIKREISASGKNICRLNDEIITLSHLNRICKKLADIHGQYDHQSLLNPEYHIQLLDTYHREDINTAKKEVATLYKNYSNVKVRLKNLLNQAARDRRERDFMQYEFEELQSADLKIGEDAELEEKIEFLQNSEKIYQNLAYAYESSSESEYSVTSTLKKISDMVSELSSYSHELDELSKRLNDIYYDFEDTASSIRNCRDSTIFSPEELDHAIIRIETINKLKNKHNKSIEELLTYQEELDEKLSNIENANTVQKQLEQELKECKTALHKACCTLSETRKKAAKSLKEMITSELLQLNFKDACFSIDFKTAENYSPDGFDIVEFMISTNRGEPLKPLSKIASGGEMSRIMLAFKKIIGDYDEIPTMIFDEIDSGISGIAASVVGQKLQEISKNHQIICITHLPQIAAFGLHNYKIQKDSDDEMTYTTILPLSKNEKIQEIARLLGGANITKTTLKSAEELIASSVE